jgi:hypothetical protein
MSGKSADCALWLSMAIVVVVGMSVGARSCVSVMPVVSMAVVSALPVLWMLLTMVAVSVGLHLMAASLWWWFWFAVDWNARHVDLLVMTVELKKKMQMLAQNEMLGVPRKVDEGWSKVWGRRMEQRRYNNKLAAVGRSRSGHTYQTGRKPSRHIGDALIDDDH